ncbi:hypothetical protein AAC387_Pa02g2997 [Persea americana]
MSHNSRNLYKLLQTCESLNTLKQLHAVAVTTSLSSDPFILAKILALSATSAFSDLSYAQQIFLRIENPKTHEWNCMIRAFSASSTPQTALSTYTQMLISGESPDNFTFPFLLRSCSRLQPPRSGELVHVHVIKCGFDGDAYVQSSLIHMYAKWGRILCAHKVFDDITAKNIVAWTTMINGYVRAGGFEEAIRLFKVMGSENVKPDEVVLTSVLGACANLGDLELGRWIHGLLGEKDVVFSTALVDMYAKCGSIDVARELFDRMPQKDVILWTVMISGYVRCNCFREAFNLFREMCSENLMPDEGIIVNVISGCARSGDIDIGKWTHHYIEVNGADYSVMIGTALIDMYAKCGEIDVASQIFLRMQEKNVCSWNAMIGGLAMHGEAYSALDLFDQMQRSGTQPDEVTFIGILTACSQVGLVGKGWHYFNCMSQAHGINPKLEHYACMVDLLGRSGLLSEAEELINNMPMEPDVVVWGALLNASRIHGNVELAEKAAELLLEMEPHNHGVYVLLSNTYGSAKRWDDVDNVRKLMKSRGITKTRGCSSIKVNGIVHDFVVGDRSPVRAKEIYEKLDSLVKDLGLMGYVAKTSNVLFDIEEEEKEYQLSHHSEKLAISFGLISTSPGAPLNIVKNLRICEDCHCFAKLASKNCGRRIIIRDLYRFHHFERGSCTCGDYW